MPDRQGGGIGLLTVTGGQPGRQRHAELLECAPQPADPPVRLALVRQLREQVRPVPGYLGQEPGLAAPAQQVPHHGDGERPGVAAGRFRPRPGRDGDGPGSDQVVDQHVDVDEQVLGWQHRGGLCETRDFDNLLSLAEATSDQGCAGINPHNAPKACRADCTMRVIQGTRTLCEVYPVRQCGTIKRWPVHERIELPYLIHRTGHHVHHTTGFDREEIIDLCIRINSVQPGAGSPNWPPCLGLFKSVVAALTYMRHNRTQAEIGESLGVSQPTISRAISAVTPLVPEATREFVPTADDLDPDAQYILDGTLLPCWSWDGHKELYSGKHKTTGMNLQLACTIYGKLAWISDPVNGSRHDNYCREESGVLLTINPRNWIGDKGYIGNNMITPFRKPAGGELLDWQKEYNSEVNKIRWMIEQVISHFKNWTIMHTDYRRPLKTFETTISAVVGLHFYRTV